MKAILIFGFCVAWTANILAANEPAPEAFRVLTTAAKEAPVISQYLKYQTEMAWAEDDQRVKAWSGIRTEQDLLRIQRELERHLLAMLGGLPSQRTPLHPQITGIVQMNGFHIEKLIYESLPGVYVSALVYI